MQKIKRLDAQIKSARMKKKSWQELELSPLSLHSPAAAAKTTTTARARAAARRRRQLPLRQQLTAPTTIVSPADTRKTGQLAASSSKKMASYASSFRLESLS